MPSDDTAQVKQREPTAPDDEPSAPDDARAAPEPEPARAGVQAVQAVQEVEAVEGVDDEPTVEELDPETRARRDAALANVRKLGDPVLRATALPVERFDQALAEEVEGMGRLMGDALGVGLAATQVGILHRVLVYRADPGDEVTALVNPVLEWASDEQELAEEGCLSLPGVHVEVERPAQVRVRARDAGGNELEVRPRGSGARHPARDGSSGRGADPRSHLARGAQGGDARDARGEGAAADGRALSIVFLGTSEFAAAILGRLAASDAHRPALVLTRPDRPSGRGRRLAPPPVAERARELALRLEQPENVNDRSTCCELIASTGAQTVVVCAFGALIKEPLLSERELLNVHPSLLPRWRGAAPIERAIMAGDRETGVSIMRLTAGLDSGPVCLAGREPIRPERHLRLAGGPAAGARRRLLVEVLERQSPARRSSRRAGRAGGHLRREDRPRGPSARPRPDGGRAGAHGARAGSPHRRAHSARRWHAARRAPRGARRRSAPGGAGVDAAGALPASSLSVRDDRLLLVCGEGALELLRVQPPGGREMDAAAYLRGHGLPGRA